MNNVVLITVLSILINHGVNVTVEKGKCTVIRSTYDDGEPMAFADVKVFKKNSKKPFLVLETDDSGRVCLIPGKGTWKVMISDGLGHGKVLSLNIKGDKSIETGGTTPPFSRVSKVLIGVSLILGLTGLYYYIKAKDLLKPGD